MKRPWLIIALLLSVGVNVGVLATLGVARAREPRAPRGGMERFDRAGEERRSHTERIAEHLRLEGETRELFLEQHERFSEQLGSTQQALRQVRHELRETVGGPEPQPERIDELLVESAGLTAEMDRAFIDNVLATRKLLDPRQQRAYLDLLSRLRDRSDRRRPGDGSPGEHRPGPPGPLF